MKKITKLSLGISLIVMIGLIAFVGCQKEMEKVKVNKSGTTKSLIEPYGDFGNVALGHFHNDHLDRLTTMPYFPINPLEKQYTLIKEHYNQYFPQDPEGLSEISPDILTGIIKPMFAYDNLKVYVENACDAGGVAENTKDYLCNIMDLVYSEGYQVAQGGKFEAYLAAIESFKKKVDGDGKLKMKDRTMINNTLTIAYYSGIYWNNAAHNVESPWNELFGNENNGGQTTYALAVPKWLKVVAVVAVDVAAGAAGSVVSPGVGAAAATAGSGMAKEVLKDM